MAICKWSEQQKGLTNPVGVLTKPSPEAGTHIAERLTVDPVCSKLGFEDTAPSAREGGDQIRDIALTLPSLVYEH